MKQKQEDYGAELQKSYERWEHVYEHGTSDPFWEDGTNLGLIRNHILYYRGKIEETMLPENYPEIYHKDVPLEVDRYYMARADEIRAAAKTSLKKYVADQNYNYLVTHREDFTPKTRQKLSIDNVIGYVVGLKEYIKEDSLVDMRRHENCEGYLKSFEECAKRMQQAPPETVQLSIFALLDNAAGLDDDDEYEME